MESLDEQDLSLFLAYQHVTSLGMKQMGNQIYKLGVSAGIDLESVDCNLSVKEVFEVYRNSQKKSVTANVEQQTKNLIYSYLRRNGYLDVAEDFAKYCNLNQNILNISTDLETIFQSKGIPLNPTYQHAKSRGMKQLQNQNYRIGLSAGTDLKSVGMHQIPQIDGKKKRITRTRKTLTAGVDFIDTEIVKFSNANSQGGSIVMIYKDFQYSFKRYLKNKDVSSWSCRRSSKLKCKGYLYYSSKGSCVIKE